MQTAQIVTFQRSALDIHHEAMSVARDIKTDYLRFFEVLLSVESRQIYYQFEVTSLHLYCVELLEISKHIANDFGIVVRKSLEVPQLATAIRTQKITIAKARKICPVLNGSNFKEWIDLAEVCSCRVIEKTVAIARPRTAVAESIKYVSGDVLEFRMAVSEEWTELLTKTKDLLSQREKRAVSSEEALFILMKDHCRKNDPVEKAERAVKRPRAGKQRGGNGRSRHRPAKAEHIVDLRDQNQCTHVSANGKRCESKRWLVKHHIQGFAEGGDHSPENLETLCWGHHKTTHMKLEENDPFVT
ncbi:MAG: HNH endonuclease signature motif containing protein [Bdellovibrionota bacterium]